MSIVYRPYTPGDLDALLQLNADSVAVLSPLDGHGLQRLLAMAEFSTVAVGPEGLVGFLLALGDGQAYASVNYRWYARRFKRFLYIDRVVVAPGWRGAGVGRQFYSLAEGHALAAELAWLVCEVDIEPPNEASLAFHERLGFVEVGRQVAGGGGKVVSLRARRIA